MPVVIVYLPFALLIIRAPHSWQWFLGEGRRYPFGISVNFRDFADKS